MKYKAYIRKLEAQQLLNQEKYDQFVREALPTLTCPNCSSPLFTFHATYRRHLYKTRECRTTIEVNRMKCRSCFRTSVLLPESVVPYKRYILVSLISFSTTRSTPVWNPLSSTNRCQIHENYSKAHRARINRIKFSHSFVFFLVYFSITLKTLKYERCVLDHG